MHEGVRNRVGEDVRRGGYVDAARGGEGRLLVKKLQKHDCLLFEMCNAVEIRYRLLLCSRGRLVVALEYHILRSEKVRAMITVQGGYLMPGRRT
jgi:hypothetical protein